MAVAQRPVIGLLGLAGERARRRLESLRRSVVTHLHSIAQEAVDNKELLRAEVSYRLILRLNRRDSAAISGLVDLYCELGRHDGAIDLEQRLIAGVPNDFFRYLDLVPLYLRLEERDKADECWQAAARFDPNSHLLTFMKGQLYRSANMLEESSESFRQVLATNPGLALAMVSLSMDLSDLNEREEATTLLEKVLRLDPSHLSAYAILASMKYYSDPNHPHVARLQQFLADNTNLRRRDAVTIHFTLGDIFDATKLYETAFHHYRSGNELVVNTWNLGHFSRCVDRQIRSFTRASIAAKAGLREGNLGAGLAFVVGMPRSGSTLVEQVLASHPDVIAGGERRDFPLFVNGLPRQLGGARDYPDCVQYVDGATVARLRSHYIEECLKLATTGKLFVDKTLANYLELGLISIVFPEAKVIHCRRDPLDTCLSCYFKHFAGVPYSNDLLTLGLMYRQYERLMVYWSDVCPRPAYEVVYERMVTDFEDSVRGLLDYCRLDWHPNCLAFHETRRPARTASQYQVKMPLYKTSIGRWRHYEPFLGELRSILNR